jgi:hypothetical protein
MDHHCRSGDLDRVHGPSAQDMARRMKCFFCGNEHEIKCPLISAYEYGGEDFKNITRIEFVASDVPTYQQPVISVQDWWLLNLPASPTRH